MQTMAPPERWRSILELEETRDRAQRRVDAVLEELANPCRHPRHALRFNRAATLEARARLAVNAARQWARERSGPESGIRAAFVRAVRA
jgi:hypothetical protein